MTIDFYYLPGSPPCRSVLLTAKALGIELNLKYTDVLKKEHLTPEFLKINPQHTIPTLVDNGFALWESRAIMSYLVAQYGKNDSLHPKDPKKRAMVDQRLYFDIGTLHARYVDYYYPIFWVGAAPDPTKLEKMKEAVELLNTFLKNQEYAAGDHLTLADLALIVTYTNYEATDFDFSPYPNVQKWANKIKTTAPGYEEANGKNALIFKEMVDKLRKK